MKIFCKLKNHKAKTTSGFTVVETLMAISILSIAITGTFTAVQNGIKFSTVARDQTVAFFLAQEAVEYIKNIRDENALNSLDQISKGGVERNWLYGIASTDTDPCYFGKVCMIDSPAKSVQYCNSASIVNGVAPNVCVNLRQSTSNGMYGYTLSWPESQFKREVQFENVSSNKEVKVYVTISWNSKAGPRVFQISETLLNRQ